MKGRMGSSIGTEFSQEEVSTKYTCSCWCLSDVFEYNSGLKFRAINVWCLPKTIKEQHGCRYFFS